MINEERARAALLHAGAGGARPFRSGRSCFQETNRAYYPLIDIDDSLRGRVRLQATNRIGTTASARAQAS